MANRHQRFDLQSVPLRDFQYARVVLKRSPFADVRQYPRVRRFEAAQDPAKAGLVHGRGQLVGKQFRLHKPSKSELNA